MRIVKAGANTTINLGRQGENRATMVLFDLSPFIRDFGSGVAQLSVQLPDDAATYPAVIQQDGDTASWIVGSEWLVTAGAGKCQLLWFVNDQLAKSETYYTRVTASIGEGTEAPDPYENWLTDILKAGADAAGERMGAEAARDAAAESAGNASVASERADALARQVGVNGGLQADLSVNDPAAPGYVHNRTHWVEREYEDVVQGSGKGWHITLYAPFTLVPGDWYTVTVNGVDYDCQCKTRTNSLYGEVPTLDTDAFFLEACSFGTPDQTGLFQVRGATSETFTTFSVKRILSETIHPLPAQFMRLTSPNGTVFELAVTNDGTLTAVEVTE